MQQKVVDKYFDFHKGSPRHQHPSPIHVTNIQWIWILDHLGVESPEQVGKHEAKLIAGFIYG